MARVRTTRNPLVVAAIVLAVAAAGAAGWGGWERYDVAHDDSAAYAEARDDALAAGSRPCRT